MRKNCIFICTSVHCSGSGIRCFFYLWIRIRVKFFRIPDQFKNYANFFRSKIEVLVRASVMDFQAIISLGPFGKNAQLFKNIKYLIFVFLYPNIHNSAYRCNILYLTIKFNFCIFLCRRWASRARAAAKRETTRSPYSWTTTFSNVFATTTTEPSYVLIINYERGLSLSKLLQRELEKAGQVLG